MVRRYTATLMHTIARSRGPARHRRRSTGGNAEALAKICRRRPPRPMPSFELAALEKALPDDRRRDRSRSAWRSSASSATAPRSSASPRWCSRPSARQLGIAEARRARRRRARGRADRARRDRARGAGARPRARTTRRCSPRRAASRTASITTPRTASTCGCSRARCSTSCATSTASPTISGVLLEVAALLHDVGEVVNQRGHHKHSEYMIRWGRIPGLDDTGREMVALMARCHRKDAARAKQIINELAAAEGAARAAAPADRAAPHRRRRSTREHRSRVEQVVCTRMGEAIVLDLVVRDGPSRDDAHAAPQGRPVQGRARPRRPRHGRAPGRPAGAGSRARVASGDRRNARSCSLKP